MATSNVNLPLTLEEFDKLRHFLLVYELGYVPNEILELAERVKAVLIGAKTLKRQERWVGIQSQKHQT